jgi:Pyruvate kinase, barrel domain
MEAYPDQYPEVGAFHKKYEDQKSQSEDIHSGKDSLCESNNSDEKEMKLSTRKQQ